MGLWPALLTHWPLDCMQQVQPYHPGPPNPCLLLQESCRWGGLNVQYNAAGLLLVSSPSTALSSGNQPLPGSAVSQHLLLVCRGAPGSGPHRQSDELSTLCKAARPVVCCGHEFFCQLRAPSGVDHCPDTGQSHAQTAVMSACHGIC